MAITTTTAMAPKNFQTSDRRLDARKESAVLEALDMFKQPARARELRSHDQPSDMLEVIKIAAGDQGTIDRWAESCREGQDIIRQSAVFFLQQTIAKSGNDKFRMMGLPSGAGMDEIRLHKRWLLKWLHPDRNPSKWETVLFHRISTAADMLENALDVNLKVPGHSAADVKKETFTTPYKPDRRRRNQHVRKNLRSPVPRMDWKDLLRRAAKRILLGVFLLAFGAAVWMIFTGSLQNTLQSILSEM
jgi:hypothetical protein